MTLEDRLAALAVAGETTHYGALARDLGLSMAPSPPPSNA